MLLNLCVFFVSAATMAFSEDNIYRLPTDIAPVHYWLILRPTFESDGFLTTGSVRILIKCINATKHIYFNTNEIEIDVTTTLLESENKKKTQIIEQDWNNETLKYHIALDSELKAGQNYYLSMNFSYRLNQNLEGFYRSSYKDSDGKTRWMATTQFSPINARRAFPCWDEPSFKAIFNITLGRHISMTSLSNMPRFLTTPIKDKEDWVWDHYEATLPVSTYLIAFIVTDLPHKDITDTETPHFKVWSRPQILEEMKYIGEISPKVLSFIADYFKTPFPLHKIDLFAVPDFGFSAMENWGLIIFAESAIKTPKTIAHELAHQWFGNLVTPQWWDDLWLKEGFATFIGVIALTGVNGNNDELDKWISDEMHHSMFEDSLWATHPVSNPVDDPRNIWQAFDAISYEKGSSIIRMMSDFLGEDVFRAGLNVYLKRFAFGNARREQLWQSYSNITETDVSTVMDFWTVQPGYPVINVTRDYPSGAFTITQERFLLNASSDGGKEFWHIPYTSTYKSDKGEKRDVSWLTEHGNIFLIEGLPKNDWLLLNLNRAGYYRVNYDLDNWALLSDDFNNLPRLSQSQLINDAFNLAIPGRLPYSVPFKLIKNIYDSKDNLLWNVTIIEMNNIITMLSGSPLSSELKNYALSLFPSEKLNYGSEHLVLVKWASYLGQKNLIEESVNAIKDMMSGKNSSYSDEVLSSVYQNGVKNSGQEVWDYMWKRYLDENKPEEKKRLMAGLASTMDQNNLKRLLEALMRDGSGVRKQEAKLVFSSVAANEYGANLALDFLSENWSKIKERYGLGYKIMSSMVLSLGPVLNQKEQLEKFQKMYKDNLNDLGSTSNAFLNSQERIQINIKWLNDHYETVQKLIEK